MRTIANFACLSDIIEVNEWNATDRRQLLARRSRRLAAEELMDAVPPRRRAARIPGMGGHGCEQLVDPHIGKEGFLDVFGAAAARFRRANANAARTSACRRPSTW